MRLSDDFDERNELSPSLISTIVAVTFFIAAILIVVLAVNHKDKPGSSPAKQTEKVEETAIVEEEEESLYPSTEELLTGSELKPEDLDFWDKYPVESKSDVEPDETSKPAAVGEVVENDPSTDGKHTKVINEKGEEEWLLISPYLPKQEYDFTKLVCQSNLMKYYEDGKLISYVGVDISKYQDYVDFVKLKKAGIDFVMLRVGLRAYETGQLILDDYYSENIKRATDAGLEVGLYFSSQAISEEEAVEEANMVLENIGEYKISYPIGFQMEYKQNDTARIDILSKAEKTSIAKAFMDTIKEAGYKAILYGTKEWLLKQIDLSKLTAYDVWLSQYEDIPDYPYQFTMWQYANDVMIDGIAGYADLNVSFIDYSEK